MGNHKLRKQLSAELNKRGLKLYSGNKREAYRFYSASEMRQMLYLLSLNPGDIVHDCDGFNHKLKTVPTFDFTNHYSFRNTYIVKVDTHSIEFEDGRLCCGCPYSPTPPEPPENIEAFFKAFYSGENYESMKEQGWFQSESNLKLKRKIDCGEPICDEFGMETYHEP